MQLIDNQKLKLKPCREKNKKSRDKGASNNSSETKDGNGGATETSSVFAMK